MAVAALVTLDTVAGWCVSSLPAASVKAIRACIPVVAGFSVGVVSEASDPGTVVFMVWTLAVERVGVTTAALMVLDTVAGWHVSSPPVASVKAIPVAAGFSVGVVSGASDPEMVVFAVEVFGVASTLVVHWFSLVVRNGGWYWMNVRPPPVLRP